MTEHDHAAVRRSIDSEDGRCRAVVEVDVPGTPEQIWDVIATGPGIEAWFVPASVEPRPGGRIVTHHGSFGDSEGVITAWEPPHRVAYDEADWQGPDTPVPTWNTEIVVESTSGDSCVVRLSSGFLTDGEKWADEIDQTLQGWTGALRNLRLYLTHFAGMPTTTLSVMQEIPDGATAPDLIAAAGLAGARVGDEVTNSDDAPRLRGTVEHTAAESVTVRTTEPTIGLIELATIRYGGTTVIVAGGHLYGPDGPDVLSRIEPDWTAWAAGLAGEPAGVRPPS